MSTIFQTKLLFLIQLVNSSRGAQIDSKIRELEPNATVKSSLNLLSDHVEDSNDKIKEWLRKIDF